MGYIIIAPVGDDSKALFVGMKKFPTEKVILITTKDNWKNAKKLSEKLEGITVKASIMQIDGNPLDGMFKLFAELCSKHDNDDLIVNVSSGNHSMTCAALSASYANGLKAIDVMGDTVIMLPIMKLSYYGELSGSKMELLHALREEKFISLTDLSEKTGMSASLISYHINGTAKHKGLASHRLVELKSENKNLYVKLSSMGGLLLKGYIKKGN